MLTPPTPTTKEMSKKVLSPDKAKVPSIVILILPMFCFIIFLKVSQVSTSINEVCEHVEQEVCQEVQETVFQEQTEQQCGTVPERECRAVSTPTQTTEYQQQCRTEHSQTCSTVYDPRQQCSTVYEEVCHEVPETNCRDVERPVQVFKTIVSFINQGDRCYFSQRRILL